METPDTQVISTPNDVQRDAIMSVFQPQSRTVAREAAPAPQQPAPVEQVTEASKKPPAETVPAAANTSANHAPESSAPSSYDSLLDSMGSTAAAVVWTPEAKAVFNSTFGTDDPSAISTRLEQAELLKAEYEKVKPFVDQFNDLPPAVLNSIKLAMAGKYKEAKEHIASTPEKILSNTPVEKLSDRDLIDTYFKGKISPDQWEIVNDPEADDDDLVDALKTRIGILREAAADKYIKDHSSQAELQTQEARLQQESYDRYNQGVASAIANVKNSPLKGFLDQGATEAIQSGSFLSRFVQEDRMTPTPEAAALYLKALHFDPAVKAADARGYARGKQEALLETTSRQPGVGTLPRRSPGDMPVNTTADDSVKALMARALSAR